MTPQSRLKHHVTGAIERGEKRAIVGLPACDDCRKKPATITVLRDIGFGVEVVCRELCRQCARNWGMKR